MAQAILSITALLGSVIGGDAAESLTGSVTYYAENVMEATYRARLQWGHVAPCADCIGMIALLDSVHIGRRVWLQRPGHAPEGPYLVVDCAAAKDRERLRARGLVAEVDWPTALRWRMAGPIDGVTVYFTAPRAPAALQLPEVTHEHPEPHPATGLLRQSRRQRPS